MIMLNIDMLDAATAASNIVQSKTALERGCCGVLAWTLECDGPWPMMAYSAEHRSPRQCNTVPARADVTAAINGYFESVALSHIRDIVTYWQPADGHVPASHPSRVTCHARGNTGPGPGLVTDIYMHSGLMPLYNCLTTLNLIKINSRIKILSFLSAALSW